MNRALQALTLSVQFSFIARTHPQNLRQETSGRLRGPIKAWGLRGDKKPSFLRNLIGETHRDNNFFADLLGIALKGLTSAPSFADSSELAKLSGLWSDMLPRETGET